MARQLIDLDRVDWSRVGDLICEALTVCRRSHKRLKGRFPNASMEQITAASLAEMMRQRLPSLVFPDKNMVS